MLYRTNSYMGEPHTDFESVLAYDTELLRYILYHHEATMNPTGDRIRTYFEEQVEYRYVIQEAAEAMRTWFDKDIRHVVWFCTEREPILSRDYGYGIKLCRENGVITTNDQGVTIWNQGCINETLRGYEKLPKFSPVTHINALLALRELAEELWELEGQKNNGNPLTNTMKTAEVKRILKLEKMGLLKKDFSPDGLLVREAKENRRSEVLQDLL